MRDQPRRRWQVAAVIDDDGWYLRTYFYENDELVYLDEGPLDWYLVNVLIADIGIDGTLPRGLTRIKVERAVLVRSAMAA